MFIPNIIQVTGGFAAEGSSKHTELAMHLGIHEIAVRAQRHFCPAAQII